MKFLLKLCLFIIGTILIWGCATLYQRSENFQQAVVRGDFEKAKKELSGIKDLKKDKNRILWYLNLGYLDFMLGNFTESNRSFEEAENLIEIQRKGVGNQALALVTNPEAIPYQPEDFEVIMINFYKALNYLQMNKMESAMVEVRKVNIKLNQLNDKYPEHKNRYRDDAFAHLLMGLIYEAGRDYNNAFVAYRNAYNTYQTDYARNFGLSAPDQLKHDLMRTAYLCGFTAELSQYEKEFSLQYTHRSLSEHGEVVMFWLNGLGPVKSEWGINFVKQDKGVGGVAFHNAELGLTFPFIWDSGYSESERNSLADVEMIRVVFPKYVERPLHYTNGVLQYNGTDYALQEAEDINQIAFKTLNDRMLRELSNSLLRFAVKKSLQGVVENENKWLGLAVSIANSLTEKADTRNWQTLPHTVSYVRVPLAQPENTLTFKVRSSRGTENNPLTFQGKKGYMQFHVFSTL